MTENKQDEAKDVTGRTKGDIKKQTVSQWLTEYHKTERLGNKKPIANESTMG